MNPRALGFLMGLLVIPVAMTAVAILAKRRGNREWWIPLIVAGVALAGIVAVAWDGLRSASVEDLDAAAVFRDGGGYTFQALPPAEAEALAAGIAADPNLRAAFRAVEARFAVRGTAQVGTVMVAETAPGDAPDVGEFREVAEGLAVAGQGSLQESTVEGTLVYRFESRGGRTEGLTVLAWQAENLLVIAFVAGEEADPLAAWLIRPPA